MQISPINDTIPKKSTESICMEITSAWQQFTLTRLRLTQWRGGSYLYRLLRGSLAPWRRGSWLMQWSEPLGFVLLACVFSFAPFVNTALIGLLLLACGAFWALLTISDQSIENFTPIHLLVLLYWGINTVATAFSPVKAAAFQGWVKLTLYLVLFAFMARILRSSRLRSGLITVYLHIALIVSAYGIRQWIDKVPPLATWNDPTSTEANVTRAYSYLGNPNLLGGYLLPAIAFSVAALLTWRGWGQRALALTMLIANCACLRYTGSRGSWIGFLALMFTLLILFWYWYKPKMPALWQKWSLPVALGTVTGVLILAVILLEPLRVRVTSIFVGRGDSSNNFRMNVWMSVIDMIRDRPILGIGPGNDAFNKVYPLFMRPRYSALSAYSIPLEIIVETGFIGFTAFLWLLVTTVNQGIIQLRRLRDQASPEGFWLISAIATLAGMLGHGLVDTVWYRPQLNTLWWLAIAVIASYYLSPKAQEQQG